VQLRKIQVLAQIVLRPRLQYIHTEYSQTSWDFWTDCEYKPSMGVGKSKETTDATKVNIRDFGWIIKNIEIENHRVTCDKNEKT